MLGNRRARRFIRTRISDQALGLVVVDDAQSPTELSVRHLMFGTTGIQGPALFDTKPSFTTARQIAEVGIAAMAGKTAPATINTASV